VGRAVGFLHQFFCVVDGCFCWGFSFNAWFLGGEIVVERVVNVDGGQTLFGGGKCAKFFKFIFGR